MGGRAGGGASGGMGSRSRSGGAKNGGSSTVFTGGWSGSSEYTSDIVIHAINKQTEKALNVKTVVSWGDGRGHVKDLWVPKSTVGTIKKNPGGTMTMSMKKSMVQSISQQNTYKGYQMQFDYSYNT